MRNPAAFAQAATACHPHAVPLDRLLYRSVALRHFSSFPSAQPLYAAPGVRSRYVGPAGQAALYAAFDPETAYRELNQEFYGQMATQPGLVSSGGLRPLPAVLIGVYVRATRLLDLRAAAVRQVFQIGADADILGPWKLAPAPTPTQLLGDAVFTGGFFEGLLYPSAQHTGHDCLVLFPARLPASGVDFRSLTPRLKDARLP